MKRNTWIEVQTQNAPTWEQAIKEALNPRHPRNIEVAPLDARYLWADARKWWRIRKKALVGERGTMGDIAGVTKLRRQMRAAAMIRFLLMQQRRFNRPAGYFADCYHPADARESNALAAHSGKSVAERSVCHCGVPMPLHGTVCGWGNAGYIVHPFESLTPSSPSTEERRHRAEIAGLNAHPNGNKHPTKEHHAENQ